MIIFKIGITLKGINVICEVHLILFYKRFIVDFILQTKFKIKILTSWYKYSLGLKNYDNFMLIYVNITYIQLFQKNSSELYKIQNN